MAWQPERMQAWRDRLGLTQTQAGEALGLSLRAIQHYEGGSRPIPRVVELACWAIEHRGDRKSPKRRKIPSRPTTSL
jgi:transcriptional regulator with XRE-family HTH domain